MKLQRMAVARYLCLAASLVAGCGGGDSTSDRVKADAAGIDGFRLTDTLSSGVGGLDEVTVVVQTAAEDGSDRRLSIAEGTGTGLTQVSLPFEGAMVGPTVWVTERSIALVGVPCDGYETGQKVSTESPDWLTTLCGNSRLTLYRMDRKTSKWSDPVEVLPFTPTPRRLGSAGSRLVFGSAESESGGDVQSEVAEVDVDSGAVRSIPRSGEADAYCPVGDSSLVAVTSALSGGGGISSEGEVEPFSGNPGGSASLFNGDDWTPLKLDQPVTAVESCYSAEGFVARDEHQKLWIHLLEDSSSLKASELEEVPTEGPVLVTSSANRELVAIEDDEDNSDASAVQQVWVLRDEHWTSLGSGLLASGDGVLTNKDGFIVIPNPGGDNGSITLRAAE